MQQTLGAKLRVDVKTVNNWETGRTSPRNHMGALEKILGAHLDGGGPSLSGASDLQLLAEIARRFERHPTPSASVIPLRTDAQADADATPVADILKSAAGEGEREKPFDSQEGAEE